MKYNWRSGNTTYFEDRRFEGAVIFDRYIKPYFVKVETTLAVYVHFSLLFKCLVNAVLTPSEAYSN